MFTDNNMSLIVILDKTKIERQVTWNSVGYFPFPPPPSFCLQFVGWVEIHIGNFGHSNEYKTMQTYYVIDKSIHSFVSKLTDQGTTYISMSGTLN